MAYPLTVNSDGVKIKPEIMEREKLYHCVFAEKIMLVYKDNQDVLHCYEIEERNLVDQVTQCNDTDKVEKILEEYAQRNLND